MTTGPSQVVYETEMTQELAEIGFHIAQAKGRESGVNMSVAVVDKAARVVLFVRGDGRGIFSMEGVVARTVGAAATRRRGIESERAGGGARTPNPIQPYAAVHGGCPVVYQGKIIGAIGCGGGSADQDQECADIGAEAIVAAFAKR